MSDIFKEAPGPSGTVAFFEEDQGDGFLAVYAPADRKILEQIKVYDRNSLLSVKPANVNVFWSTDQTKCGVVIDGRMIGIIDIGQKRSIRADLTPTGTSPIRDEAWLNGFDQYLDSEKFIAQRERYWRARADAIKANVEENYHE